MNTFLALLLVASGTRAQAVSSLVGRRCEDPKRRWAPARVIRIFPEKDDTVRVCKVKAGLYKKPGREAGAVGGVVFLS